MTNPENILAAAVNMTVKDLSKAELAQFYLGLTWGNGQSREECKDKPWFGKVEHLFTEKEGQEVHEVTREIIGRIANLRLTQ